MASTSSVTARQARVAAAPSVNAADLASTAAALLDLARASDIIEEQIDRVIAGHANRSRSPPGERPPSEVHFLMVAEAAMLM